MNLLTRANFTLIYLALVLVMGGASAAGVPGNVLLQILGAGLAAWSLVPQEEGPPVHTGLARFGQVALLLCLVQFLPLPAGLWRLLPGREAVYHGFVLLDVAPGWQTLSLAPWKALGSFTWWIPAFALFMSMRAPGAPETREVVMTIAAIAIASVAVGSVQVVAGTFYFYDVTNFGKGTGFFANANHQGSFLLCALALWSAWVIGEHRKNPPTQGKIEIMVVVYAAISLLFTIGVLFSGSLACLILLFPVLGALVLIARPDMRLPLPVVLVAGVVAIGGMAAVLLLGAADNDLATKGVVPGISRQEFLINGLKILRDFAPFGTGTGTFVEIYRWYEDPAQVTTTFVNHAHDDLLELLIETGVFGFAAVAAFLAWLAPRTWTMWSGSRRNALQLVASVIICVALAHSLVDYPLRTAAMSSFVAIACVLMVRPSDPPRMRSGRISSRKSRDKARKDMVKI